jgi:hypothetical protein
MIEHKGKNLSFITLKVDMLNCTLSFRLELMQFENLEMKSLKYLEQHCWLLNNLYLGLECPHMIDIYFSNLFWMKYLQVYCRIYRRADAIWEFKNQIAQNTWNNIADCLIISIWDLDDHIWSIYTSETCFEWDICMFIVGFTVELMQFENLRNQITQIPGTTLLIV